MTSTTHPAPPVNPSPAYFRRGQSVLIVGIGRIGVVVHVDASARGPLYSVALWPATQRRCLSGELEPLASDMSCRRSRGQQHATDCTPRVSDGLCVWCAQSIPMLDERAGEIRTVFARGVGWLAVEGDIAVLRSDDVAYRINGTWQLAAEAKRALGGAEKCHVLDALRRLDGAK